ncbi:MAG: TRAM domain-containing protein [Armatimonadota bacterium]|nr:MAG: TRAM domain-containing protein [Armatimonadota bacterium]
MGFLFSLALSLVCAVVFLEISEIYLNLPIVKETQVGAYFVPWYKTAFAVLGLLIGFTLAGVIFRQLVELASNLERIPAPDKVAGVVGLIIGLTLVALLGRFVLPIPRLGPFLVLLLGVACIYLGGSIAMSMKEELSFFMPNLVGTRVGGGAGEPAGSRIKLLDTNVIIDGRIADICRTGFVEGPIYIPGFVLEELHLIADSADSLKRNRGRRGLDILNHMQDELKMLVQVYDRYEIPLSANEGVDMKLVKLAKDLDAAIVTNDFNLNKVAQLQGIAVLNVNELANAVKPVVLPGEEMSVTVVKEGKEVNQGVAYLDDGTMVVVEDGKRHIGETLPVVVTSVLQTVAGKMIFGNLRADATAEEGRSGRNSRADSGGRFRRKTRSAQD